MTPEQSKNDTSFDLDATEEELLEEFGVLMAAEYCYATGQDLCATLASPGDDLELARAHINNVATPLTTAQRKAAFEAAKAGS